MKGGKNNGRARRAGERVHSLNNVQSLVATVTWITSTC